MTKQEAILHIKKTQPIFNDGDIIDGCDANLIDEQLCEAIGIAIECIEKQIPRKPFLENAKGIFGVDMWHCPVCKGEIISDWNRDIASPYCHHCAQAIDWGGNE